MGHIAVYITTAVLIGICAWLVLAIGAVNIFPITTNKCNWKQHLGYQAEYSQITTDQNFLLGHQTKQPQTSGNYNTSFANPKEEK